VTLEVRSFEHRLLTFLAADPECHGLQVSMLDFKKSNLRRDMTWSFMVDYQADNSSQEWSIVGKSPSYLEGVGTPREIANLVCRGLMGRGAIVND
jgi:hypothetical protein